VHHKEDKIGNDARMVACTIVLCVQYACEHLFCVTFVVIS
jgi:hypothetical protein